MSIALNRGTAQLPRSGPDPRPTAALYSSSSSGGPGATRPSSARGLPANHLGAGRGRSTTRVSSGDHTRISADSATAGDFIGAARIRWLPDQPTFLCLPSFAQGPFPPGDEAWAQRGIFFCYGKAYLSYSDVERLLLLSNLDISPAEFRSAAAVVWAYRYRSETPPPPFCASLSFSAPDTSAREREPALASPRRKGGAGSSGGGGDRDIGIGSKAKSRRRNGSSGKSSGGSGSYAEGSGAGGHSCDGVPGIELIGYASAEVGRGLPQTERVTAGRSCRGASAAAVMGPAAAVVAAASSPAPLPDTADADADAATIWFLAVHPGLRRQGLGRALLERLVSELYGSHGVALVSLRATSRSAALYDRVGLRRDPLAPLVRGGG